MTALITGASSGIGRDIARYLALKGYNLILVARREERLSEIKSEIKNVDVKVISSDLSNPENCFKLYEETRNFGVDFLVNNAGFGAYGKFSEVPLEKELELIDTNIKALHILTKLYLKDMIEKNSGYILNVGSVAGFLAGPTFSSYYASKNYVVRLTEAIHEEMKRDKINVKVSVLCPGPVNTEFNKVANVNFVVGGLSSEYVAKYAVEKTLKGKMVITPGKLMKLAKFGEHFLSENLLTKI
ncbi:MAG: SDR family oxidoreductase, partial [Ruminococcus sp.]|nr:SDR family oxidoreductase [Ruminococcus sp.]